MILLIGTKPSRKNPTKNQLVTKNNVNLRYTRCDTQCTGRFPFFAGFDPFFIKRYSLNATILTRENSLHMSNYRSKRLSISHYELSNPRNRNGFWGFFSPSASLSMERFLTSFLETDKINKNAKGNLLCQRH